MHWPPRLRHWLVLLWALSGACSASDSDGPEGADIPDPLAALPAPDSVETDRFRDSAACGQCHLLGESETSALKDSSGRDVSPVMLWRSSMMALAARDPYYLAAFSDELRNNPQAQELVNKTCSRCHAPAGTEERAQSDSFLSFDELVSSDHPAAVLGRDGVTCSLCHQIRSDDLGTEASFSGGFEVAFTRQIYGLYQNPLTDPMMFFVNYTPTYGPHVGDAELCATCHTVIVRGLDASGSPSGPEVVEQATYLEWLNSDYAGTEPCQTCHVPATDEDGVVIATQPSKLPDDLNTRQPFGRHLFVGGNSYMLRLLASANDWAQHNLDPAELEASAARAEKHLATAADLTLEATRSGETLSAKVTVVNLAGHKLPTGYPSRRMWIHLRVQSGSSTVFESGATDETGTIVGGVDDDPDQIEPHHQIITEPRQVQIYQAILVDDDDAPTHRAFAARRYGKDTRLLPAGWTATGPHASRTGPVGTGSDPDFLAGVDSTVFEISQVPSGPLSVEVELLYQSVPPGAIRHLAKVPTSSAARFTQLAASRVPVPVVIADSQQTVP